MIVRLDRWRLAATVAVIAAAPSWALTAGDAGHGAHHAPTLGDLLLPVINFTIFLLVLVRYVLPELRLYLRRRREQAVATATESAAALAAAEQTLVASQERRAALAAECESICRDRVAAATRQAERLRAEAEASGTRRLGDAALLAEQERRRALDAVRAEIAAVAAALAERRIRAALAPDDQRAFVRRFLEDAAAPR
jgi:F-type H+-transporting ATPase subunit b